MSDDPIDSFFMKVITGLIVLIVVLALAVGLSIVCMRLQDRVIEGLRSELNECRMNLDIFEDKEGK